MKTNDLDRLLRDVALPIAEAEAGRAVTRLAHRTTDTWQDYLSDAQLAAWLHLRDQDDNTRTDRHRNSTIRVVCRRAIIDGIRKRHGRTDKWGPAQRTYIESLEALSEQTGHDAFRYIDQRYADVEAAAWRARTVPALLHGLTGWQRHVIEQHVLAGRSLRSVGEDRGSSASAVCQVVAKALPVMRRAADELGVTLADVA